MIQVLEITNTGPKEIDAVAVASIAEFFVDPSLEVVVTVIESFVVLHKNDLVGPLHVV